MKPKEFINSHFKFFNYLLIILTLYPIFFSLLIILNDKFFIGVLDNSTAVMIFEFSLVLAFFIYKRYKFGYFSMFIYNIFLIAFFTSILQGTDSSLLKLGCIIGLFFNIISIIMSALFFSLLMNVSYFKPFLVSCFLSAIGSTISSLIADDWEYLYLFTYIFIYFFILFFAYEYILNNRRKASHAYFLMLISPLSFLASLYVHFEGPRLFGQYYSSSDGTLLVLLYFLLIIGVPVSIAFSLPFSIYLNHKLKKLSQTPQV